MPATSTQNQKKQLRILLGLLACLALTLGYSFLPRLEFPTARSLKRLRERIEDKKLELAVAKDDAENYRQALQEATRDYSALKYNANLEKDAVAAVNAVLDEANMTFSKTSVRAGQNRAKSNFQTVHIDLEFEGITMQKLSELFWILSTRKAYAAPHLQLSKVSIFSRTQRAQNRPARPGAPMPNTTQGNTSAQQQLNASITITATALSEQASEIIFAPPSEDIPNTAKNASAKGDRK